MIKIDVFVKNKNWKKYISNPSKYLESRTKNINNYFSSIKNKNVNFSILLAGNQELRKLNKKFKKKNKTTDVLSFPFYKNLNKTNPKTKNIYLGDIILNFYKINKKDFKKDFNRLWVHGFLHLLGYRHFKNKDFYKMSKLENLILKKIDKN